jgi:hypothetical protein
MVKFGAILKEEIETVGIDLMKKKFLAGKSTVVFNDKDCSQIPQEEAERLQIVTKTFDSSSRKTFTGMQRKLLISCEKASIEAAKEILGNKQTIKSMESVLLSKNNSNIRQDMHMDLPYKLKGGKGVLALACLEPGTRIIMLRSSHKGIKSIGFDSFPRIYELRIGDILFLHPNLIHAGDCYVQSNIRVHYYLLQSKVNWDINSTYPAELDISDKLDVILKNITQQEHRELCIEERLQKKRKRALVAFNNQKKRWQKKNPQRVERATINLSKWWARKSSKRDKRFS